MAASGNARRWNRCDAGRVPLRSLIVDDSKAFLEAARALHEQLHLSVAVASTGAEALQRAETFRPDVILVDVFLGDESGLELAMQLVEGGNGPTVILISTHAEADLVDLIAASPAAGFPGEGRAAGSGDSAHCGWALGLSGASGRRGR